MITDHGPVFMDSRIKSANDKGERSGSGALALGAMMILARLKP